MKLSIKPVFKRIVVLVSIPKRVSEALKQSIPTSPNREGLVSIPKRVSEALKQAKEQSNDF